MLTRRADRQILFVDMNSYFASCEQADNPALRGKPIIVVPTEGSCALAASYEAKYYGIRTGTREREAKFLCPQVISVMARPKRYMEYHHRFVEVLQNLTPRVSVRSVDEASIRLCDNEDPWELGQQIKEAIWRDLSPAINCSIGIGPNVFLAKLGTEMQKPDGLVEIRLQDLERIYDQVKLRDFCGINYAMERRLQNIGINSPLEFYRTNPVRLRQALGIIGERWWLKMHGYPIDEHYTERKSLSHSHVLPPHQRTVPQAYVTLQRLVTKVGRRLRKDGYMARHISLYIRFADKTGWSGGFWITPANDTLSLSDHIQQLWQQANPREKVVQLAIWTHELVRAAGIPEPLFPLEQKRKRLARALDSINDRYGTNMVRFAILDRDGSRAPDRIAFSSLYDIEHE